VKNQVTRYFKGKISDEENSRDDSILLAADSKVMVHRQLRKTDVEPIDHRDDVKQEQKRNQPNLHLPDGPVFNRLCSAAWAVCDRFCVLSARQLPSFTATLTAPEALRARVR